MKNFFKGLLAWFLVVLGWVALGVYYSLDGLYWYHYLLIFFSAILVLHPAYEYWRKCFDNLFD